MDEIKIAQFQKSDWSQFQEFARKSFHPKYILSDERFFDWQYQSLGATMMLAKHGEEIIGFFGYKDFPYKIYGETKNIRAVMNLFAAEKYRMAGAGPMLAEKVFDTKNYILVSSYNDPAQKLYRHLRKNWTEAGDFRRYFAVLGDWDKIRKIFKDNNIMDPRIQACLPAGGSEDDRWEEGLPRHSPRLSGTPLWRGNDDHFLSLRGGVANEAISRVGGFVFITFKNADNRFDNFWARTRQRYPIAIERTADYLNWRFFNHPIFRYENIVAEKGGSVYGYLFWRIEESDGFKIARMIDFVADESAEISLLAEFLRQAKEAGAQAADFMFSGNFYKESLLKAGFFDIKGTDFEKFPIRFNPLSYSKFVINIAYDIPAMLEDCYLTKADSDQDRPNPH